MQSQDTLALTFLLGSGVSIPAGMPSTRDITDRVLSGEGVFRHTDGNYYFGNPMYAHAGIPDEYVPLVVTLLKRVKVVVDQYYKDYPKRPTTYEDLYHVVSQINDSQLGEYDNPAVQPLIDKILTEIQPLLVGMEGKITSQWPLDYLTTESVHYIRDVVWHLLAKEPNRTDHLISVRDSCVDPQVSSVDIFTLNHDLTLERCFSQNGIEATDGFGKPLNDVRYWESELFDREPFKVRLYKLHGSVNWFRLLNKEACTSNQAVGIPLNLDPWHTRDRHGQMQWPADGRPMILLGTFNKMLQYTSEIYANLHCHFHRSLRNARRLVVCGYGFGDKGINSQIAEWTCSSAEQRMIVIHPDPPKLKESARGAISNNWDQWINQDRLTIIAKAIEGTSSHEIKDSLCS